MNKRWTESHGQEDTKDNDDEYNVPHEGSVSTAKKQKKERKTQAMKREAASW